MKANLLPILFLALAFVPCVRAEAESDGKVLAVRADIKLVMISIGSQNHVQAGSQYSVKSGGKQVAKIQIDKVYADMSSAKIIEGDGIQANDDVFEINAAIPARKLDDAEIERKPAIPAPAANADPHQPKADAESKPEQPQPKPPEAKEKLVEDEEPVGISGTEIGSVLAVRMDVKLVMISAGSQHKIEAGNQFVVLSNGIYKCRIKVDKVYPDMSSAKIIAISPSGGAPEPGDKVIQRKE